MPRHRSVLGRVAITVVIGLGLPSLTAAASDGSEPGPSGPSTENSVSTVSGGADVGASESTTTTTTAPDTTTSTTAAPTSTEVPATTQAPTTTEVPAPTPQTPTTIETAATSTAQAPTNTQVPLAAPQKPTTLEIAPPSTPPLVPSEPMGITSTPGDGSVTLHWTPPAADGDSPILRYTIEHQKSGTADWVPDGDVGTATSALVTGLTNGTTYLFQITAVNAIGPGTPAAAKDTPRTVPTAPRSPTAVPLNEPGKIRLTWALPTFDGGSAITGYVIQRSADGVSGWKAVTVGVSVTVYTVTGLTPGARYYFRVSARNDVGGGASSGVVNAVARGVSSAPRSLTAAPTMVSGQIRVSWTAPLTNGGSAVTDYAIQRSPNGTTWTSITDGTSTATAYTVTGLTNGTRYYFRVYARNAFGSSPASSVSNAIPVNALLAPRSLAAAPTNLSGQVRLTWTAPLSDGGSAITDYVIRRSPNGSTGWTTIADGVNGTRAYTVTGLSNGTRYYFRVYARTSRATSPSSNIVNAIPRTKPSAPRSAAAAPTNLSGQVRLRWVAPSSSGGSAITDYIIQRSANGTTWTSISDGVSTATAYTVAGLTNGARYYFRIVAKNAAGTSPTSAAVSAIPRTVPSAPTGLHGRSDPHGYFLDWEVPASNGGSAITGYVLDYSNGLHWVRIGDGFPTITQDYVTGRIGCLDFRVAATNGVGAGPFSYLHLC